MAWGEHWEWRAFFDVPDDVRHAIEALPRRWGPADTGPDVTDTYLWRPGIRVNAKLRVDSVRPAELKLKRFVRHAPDGAERWLEDPSETFGFPLTEAAWAAVLEATDSTDAHSLPPPDPETLRAGLPELSPPLTVVTLAKHRLHHLDPTNNVTVELARVFSPVPIDSVGLEVDFGPDAEARELAALRSTIARLHLAQAPHPESYLAFIARLNRA